MQRYFACSQRMHPSRLPAYKPRSRVRSALHTLSSILIVCGVLLLADAGLAVIGTLVGALAVQTRARDLLVPLLALPLSLPVLIAGANATAPLLLRGGAEPLDGQWLLILALYDVVFGLIAYAVFDYLLED